MAGNTGKVREFRQSGKVGTMPRGIGTNVVVLFSCDLLL